jgi:peptidoglycan/LPS O-acetylase OafA/YrhL
LGPFNHFWSLAVEEHFYLMWPLIIYLCDRKTGMWVCGGTILLATALRVALLESGVNYVALEVLTPCRMDALALGGLLALAVRGEGGVRSLLPWAIAGAAVSGPLVAVSLLRDKRFLTLHLSLYAVLFGAILIFALNATPTSWAGRLWNSRTLRFFGKYSYGLYVFQNPLILVLAPVLSVGGLTAVCGSDLGARIVYAVAMTGVTVVIALISWNVFEKHFLRLKTLFGGP